MPHGFNGKLVDLTAPLGRDTCTYPTDPPFHLSWAVTFEEAGACCSQLELGPHAGTHVDAPLHFLRGGATVGSLPAELFCGEAVVVLALKRPYELIEIEDFHGLDIRQGDIVLVRTGWDARINTPQLFEGEWPGWRAETVRFLAELGVKAIGTDSPSADSPAGIAAGAPAHHEALSRGMPIFETLVNLQELVGLRVWFSGLPLKLEEGEASPVRAVAWLP